MALYCYAKHTKTRKRHTFVRFFSFVFISIGISILLWVLFPIVSFEMFYTPRFGSDLTSPIGQPSFTSTIKEEFSQVLGISDVDYTRASLWFPKARNVRIARTESTYTLSIPKVHIANATVMIGSEDLSKSLIHFAGPLPGNYGNPVIFGHSTLPFLYDPKNYKTIFSKLPDLKAGDIIYVTSDNLTYKYSVYEMKVVSAEDASVLEQNYQDLNITLVTCVPPGTYFKRLVVKAKLVLI
jgi:sortase A